MVKVLAWQVLTLGLLSSNTICFSRKEERKQRKLRNLWRRLKERRVGLFINLVELDTPHPGLNIKPRTLSMVGKYSNH